MALLITKRKSGVATKNQTFDKTILAKI